MFVCKAQYFAIAVLFVFQNIGEFGAKRYFRYRQAANTIQLVVAIKGHFSGLFFFLIISREKEFSKD